MDFIGYHSLQGGVEKEVGCSQGGWDDDGEIESKPHSFLYYQNKPSTLKNLRERLNFRLLT